MELVKNLDTIGDPILNLPVARGLIVVTECVLIRMMCLGLYLYEQDILPPIATSLAYCPLKCVGSTPSVQVLSQTMTVTNMRRNRKTSKVVITLESEIDYLARFTIMLRCSYVCARVGVAFFNVVPISVSEEGEVRLLLKHHQDPPLVRIQNEDLGYRQVRLRHCEEDVRHVRGLELEVDYEAMRNTAYVTRMNVIKTEGSNPIPETITEMESKNTSITGRVTNPNQEYQWMTYPNGVLTSEIPETCIAHLARFSFTKGLFSDVGSPTDQPKTARP